MPNTYTLIASYAATGTVSDITFSSIPSTYTDLCIKYSIRGNAAYTAGYAVYYLNGDTSTSYTNKYLIGDGSTTSSAGSTGASNYSRIIGGNQQANSTANVFSSGEIYIPNYANTSYNKTISGDGVGENDATNANAILVAALYPSTSAITSVSIVNYDSGGMAQYSTAYLYGIKNS